MRVTVDSEICQGHGRCYTLFPQLFTSDAEGYGQAADVKLDGELVVLAHEAVDVCPECAIAVVDDDGTSAAAG